MEKRSSRKSESIAKLDHKKLDKAFKTLCASQPIPLKTIYPGRKTNKKLLPILPSDGCIYVFWWIGNKGKMPSFVRKELSVVGPGNQPVIIIPKRTYEKLHFRTCLYVGKTQTDFKKRLSQHLRIKTKNEFRDYNCAYNGKLIKDCTTNQLRRGLERLYWKPGDDLRNWILENVGVSFVPMPGKREAVNRFFLENKAIGVFLPLLNVDIER